MSTLAEIEAAIARLPDAELAELTAWFWKRQEAPGKKDRGETASIRSLIGAFTSGKDGGADHVGIDAELSKEAARSL